MFPRHVPRKLLPLSPLQKINFWATCVPKGSSKRVSSSTWCGVGLVVPQITSSLISTSESRDLHCPGPSCGRHSQQRCRGRRYFCRDGRFWRSKGRLRSQFKVEPSAIYPGVFYFLVKVCATRQRPSDGSLPLQGASPPLSLVSIQYFFQFRARHLNRLSSHALHSQLLPVCVCHSSGSRLSSVA